MVTYGLISKTQGPKEVKIQRQFVDSVDLRSDCTELAV